MAITKRSSDGRRPFWQEVRYGRGGWFLVRPAIDAAVALVLFIIVSMTLTCAPSSANPQNPGSVAQLRSLVAEERPSVEIATTSSPEAPDAVYRRTSFSAAWVLLSFAFSILVAFNLAFLRHMRRAYARTRERPAVSGRSSSTGI